MQKELLYGPLGHLQKKNKKNKYNCFTIFLFLFLGLIFYVLEFLNLTFLMYNNF